MNYKNKNTGEVISFVEFSSRKKIWQGRVSDFNSRYIKTTEDTDAFKKELATNNLYKAAKILSDFIYAIDNNKEISEGMVREAKTALSKIN